MAARTIDLRVYRKIVVLTGAGLSAPSGLPTYRGPGGIWTDEKIEAFATASAPARDPEGVWRFFGELRAAIARAQPNPAHLALARAAERLGSEQRMVVITQNVDGLHRRAGSPDVIEMHGSLWRSRCTVCEFSREEDLAAIAAACPACPDCARPLRPDVVLFEEPIPVAAEHGTKRALRGCDLFIAIGTSGTVYPAAGFVRAAEYAGARTVYVNLTPLDPPNPAFHDTVLGPAEELLPALLGV